MANVLGTLFQDIADAIRGKTGDTATMKPAEFPDKIAAIETGGGGSGGTLVVKQGTFTATGTTETITHDLGTIPLFVYFFPLMGIVETGGKAFFGAGISQVAADAGGLTQDMSYYLTWNDFSNHASQATPEYTIETTSSSAPVSCATETTVKLGCSSAGLISGTMYKWCAMGLKAE